MTGWPPGLLQDDCKKLSRWLAAKPDARYIVRKQNEMTNETDPHAELMRLVDEVVAAASRESITACKGGYATAIDALDTFSSALTDRLTQAEQEIVALTLSAANRDARITELEAGARWYMIDNDDMAALCANREDAEEEAAAAQAAWPSMGPHRAVQMMEIGHAQQAPAVVGPFAWTMTNERRWQITYDYETAGIWESRGATVIPLYTSPQPQQIAAPAVVEPVAVLSADDVSEIEEALKSTGQHNRLAYALRSRFAAPQPRQIADRELRRGDAIGTSTERVEIQAGNAQMPVVSVEYLHEDTGIVGHVDEQQVEWGFFKNNARLQFVCNLVRQCDAQAALAAQAVEIEALRKDSARWNAWVTALSGLNGPNDSSPLLDSLERLLDETPLPYTVEKLNFKFDHAIEAIAKEQAK